MAKDFDMKRYSDDEGAEGFIEKGEYKVLPGDLPDTKYPVENIYVNGPAKVKFFEEDATQKTLVIIIPEGKAFG